MGDGVGDADALEDGGQVVGDDAISSPLNHNTNKQTDEQTVAIARRRDEELPGGTSSKRGLALDCFADLTVVVDNKRVVLVAICVELGQNIESLFLAAVRDEETRRLRDDEET